jgi:hypothetical protein
VLDGHVLVLELLRLLVRTPDHLQGAAGKAGLGASGDPGQALHLPGDGGSQRRGIGAGLLQQRATHPSFLLDHGREQVLGLELGIAKA